VPAQVSRFSFAYCRPGRPGRVRAQICHVTAHGLAVSPSEAPVGGTSSGRAALAPGPESVIVNSDSYLDDNTVSLALEEGYGGSCGAGGYGAASGSAGHAASGVGGCANQGGAAAR
jgi:hypothetical protein